MAPPTAAALAAVKSLRDCTDFQLTVRQHLPQLQSYFQDLLYAASSLESLKQFYVTSNPLITAFAFSLALAPVFLIVSEVNRNYSQVDRCWSFLPTIYALHYTTWAHLAGMPTQKVDLLAAVCVVWSVS